MFPIRNMNSLVVGPGEHMIGPTGLYLLEKRINIDKNGSFYFWRGSKVFKAFRGDISGGGGQTIVDDATVYEFVGEDWECARVELESFFDAWVSRWFLKVKEESGEDGRPNGRGEKVFG